MNVAGVERHADLRMEEGLQSRPRIGFAHERLTDQERVNAARAHLADLRWVADAALRYHDGVLGNSLE